jgi:hypothetical protein
MLIVFGLAIVLHIIVFFILKLCFLKNKSEKQKIDAFILLGIFANAGFLGIPFIDHLTKDPEAVIYATAFMCGFNVMLWTLGVYIVTGDLKKMRPQKAFLNPAIIVLVFAIPMFFVPQINIFRHGDMSINMLGQGVYYLALTALPISMIIVGMRMADLPAKEVFNSVGLYASNGLKLLLAPLVSLLVLLPFILTGAFSTIDPENYMYLVIIMLMSAPPAASSVAIAGRYGGDTDTVVRGFILGTILSIITMPVMLTVLSAVL